jgi:signal-transduction protein with cAMP-binding, CBS, and nucleotidyltransferase domain
MNRCLIHTVATAPGDIISEKGEYGRRLYVVCEGVVHVSEDAGEEGPKLIRIIEDSQAEPVFGTSAMLDNVGPGDSRNIRYTNL